MNFLANRFFKLCFFSRLKSGLAWLKNGAKFEDWQAVEKINREAVDTQKALVTVRGKIRSRETCHLKKKIGVY